MKLTGDLKKQVEKAESKEEKKGLIENAGMLLTDDELEQVSGGGDSDLFHRDTGANRMLGHDDEPPVPNDNGSPLFDMSDRGETMEFRFP